MFEKILIIAILLGAVYILFRSFKKNGNSGCDCSKCSSHCSLYNQHKNDNDKQKS